MQGLPGTPDELLRYINSDEFKAARAEQLRLVRSSYQVLLHARLLFIPDKVEQ